MKQVGEGDKHHYVVGPGLGWTLALPSATTLSWVPRTSSCLPGEMKMSTIKSEHSCSCRVFSVDFSESASRVNVSSTSRRHIKDTRTFRRITLGRKLIQGHWWSEGHNKFNFVFLLGTYSCFIAPIIIRACLQAANVGHLNNSRIIIALHKFRFEILAWRDIKTGLYKI